MSPCTHYPADTPTPTNVYILFLTLSLPKINHHPPDHPETVQTAGVGVVLHQPLKRQILRKNGDF